MRSWRYFNEEEATKFAKGNLAIQRIPLTEENIKNELDDIYTEWLALKLNDIIHANDGWSSGVEVHAFYNKLKTISTKYYTIILQWLYDEPILYEGKYFKFEEVYNKVNNILEYENISLKSLNGIRGFNFIVDNIDSFNMYEIEMEKNSNLTNKDLKEYEELLVSDMFGNIFDK